MNILDQDYRAGLLEKCNPPCLSIYQSTHRHHPDNQQDQIRFRNLVKELEASLLQQYPKPEVRSLLEPFLKLAEDSAFWNHTLDGLAVLGSRDTFRVYRLQRAFGNLAIAADSFHTKPLVRILQSVDRFQVLAINRQEVKLFEGNRDTLDEIELDPNVPRTLTDALGDEKTDAHLTVASYGGVSGAQSPMYHGHGGKKDEVDKDAERFFRAVDRAILEFHSQPSNLPLILAALPEHHHMFHELSANSFLVEDSIDVHPDALSSIDELRDRAWQVLEPRYQQRLNALVEQFGDARANGLGHEELDEVARDAVNGRVATLMIEARRETPGRIDPNTGAITLGDQDHPEVDDVFDDLGTLTMKMGGQVLVLPAEKMPTKTGIAAIYRY